MSAAFLREAAALMRSRAEASAALAMAVADWMDLTAVDGDNGYDESDDNFAHAIAAAAAYLGRQP